MLELVCHPACWLLRIHTPQSASESSPSAESSALMAVSRESTLKVPFHTCSGSDRRGLLLQFLCTWYLSHFALLFIYFVKYSQWFCVGILVILWHPNWTLAKFISYLKIHYHFRYEKYTWYFFFCQEQTHFHFCSLPYYCRWWFDFFISP